MLRIIKIASFALILAVTGFSPDRVLAQSGGTVREIVVEGAQRIEPATVRSYLLIQEGDLFSPSRIDRSLKSLFATGLFADVTMRRDKDALIVTVVENPVINRIAFEGNQRIEDNELEAEVILRPRVIYTRTKVQNDVKRLLTLYRRNGRFAATVEPKVIRLQQNRVDLVFEINEGRLTEIRKIRFVGNEHISDSRLKSEIRTTESRWYNFLTSDDTYDPDRLMLDRELVRRYYLSNGYADIKVTSAVAELTPDRKDFFITFTVEEGPLYTLGTIGSDVRLRGLDENQISESYQIKTGDEYNASKIDKTVEKLTTLIGTMGYAFVDIRPRIDRDRENKLINIVFEINEGPRVFVERIDITGNVRTVDDVIRREFRLVEGDAFNSAQLRRSRQRINNLNFFEKVSVEQTPGSQPDKTVIKVDVEEKSTGSLSVGAGFSTTNGALLDMNVRERNLLGRGQDLRLSFVLAQRRSQIDLGFTEPYFLGREISAGFDVFHTTTDFQNSSSFDSRVTGGDLRAGYRITEDLSQNWKYTVKKSEIRNVDSGASIYIRASEGKRTLSEISHVLTYDKRNSIIRPTEGYYLRMTNDIAGLGGTTNYIRNRFDAGKYYPITDQWILSLKGSGGYIFGINQDVHILDRFFLGGDDLRGFASGGVGPRDSATSDALGGEWMYSATAELSFPLGLPDDLGVSGKIFSDLGSSGKISPSGSTVVDTGSVRVSLGAGVTWISPFGPIGVDFGFPIVYEDFDQIENIRINFGTRF